MDITVLDTGVMGQGIADASARAGHEVTIYGSDGEAVEGCLENIEHSLQKRVDQNDLDPKRSEEFATNINKSTGLGEAAGDADLIIEAGPEDLEAKRSRLSEAEAASEDAILATHTSALSIAEVMGDLEHPERSIGLHFFNPVPVIDLVEVVITKRTSGETTDAALTYVRSMSKEHAVIDDVPGFVSSRIGVMFCVEALRIVEEGIATPAEVDEIMRTGYRYPMGPIELCDHLGLDVQLDVLDYLRMELGERFRPPQNLKNKVRAGDLGRKAGEGFYIWENGQPRKLSDKY